MRSVLSILVLSVLATTAHAAEQFVAVPEVAWSEVAPYLEANLRVEYSEGTVSVGASDVAYERKLVEPYDPALGELVKVLLVEAMADRRVQKIIRRTTQTLKDSRNDVETLSREELFAVYWQQLTADGRFSTHVRDLFLRAQATGRLRCRICSEGFAPQHLVVQ